MSRRNVGLVLAAIVLIGILAGILGSPDSEAPSPEQAVQEQVEDSQAEQAAVSDDQQAAPQAPGEPDGQADVQAPAEPIHTSSCLRRFVSSQSLMAALTMTARSTCLGAGSGPIGRAAMCARLC